MNRKSWICWIFIIAFALSLVHQILPHTHSNVEDRQHKDSAKHHNRSHTHNSKSNLPVFTHFSNSDFITNTKRDNVKKAIVIEFLAPLVANISIQRPTTKKSLWFKARDWPSGYDQSPISLRAPPVSIS